MARVKFGGIGQIKESLLRSGGALFRCLTFDQPGATSTPGIDARAGHPDDEHVAGFRPGSSSSRTDLIGDAQGKRQPHAAAAFASSGPCAVLVVSEVGLALVLLHRPAALDFIRTFVNLRAVDPRWAVRRAAGGDDEHVARRPATSTPRRRSARSMRAGRERLTDQDDAGDCRRWPSSTRRWRGSSGPTATRSPIASPSRRGDRWSAARPGRSSASSGTCGTGASTSSPDPRCMCPVAPGAAGRTGRAGGGATPGMRQAWRVETVARARVFRCCPRPSGHQRVSPIVALRRARPRHAASGLARRPP